MYISATAALYEGIIVLSVNNFKINLKTLCKSTLPEPFVNIWRNVIRHPSLFAIHGPRILVNTDPVDGLAHCLGDAGFGSISVEAALKSPGDGDLLYHGQSGRKQCNKNGNA